jgi:hypothetical protein
MSPFLSDAHIEQVFSVGFQFVLHMIDDFVSDAIFYIVLSSFPIDFAVGQVLYFVPFLDVSSALDGTEIVKEDA